MSPIGAIATNTFRETIRAKTLYLLLAAGALTVGTATLLSPVALGETVRVTKDIGLATADVLGMLIVGILGTTLVYKEIDRRTIVVILAKPIRRHEFLLGKFFGLALAIAVVVAAQGVFVQGALWLAGSPFDPRIWLGVAMTWMALATITAVAIFFSAIAGPLVAGFLTLCTFVAGRLVGDLADLATQHGLSGLEYVAYVLPNLASMNVRAEIVHGVPFDWPSVALAVVHGVSYSAAVLVIASMAFRTRQFR